jgi:iron complex outermembrane receptor protein
MTMGNLFTGASLGALLLASAPALAQNAPAAAKASEPSVGEIIVTANKREQSLNSVGLSIQAASGTELTQRGISSPADLAKLVPGFTFTQSIYSTPVFTLRGIGLYDATFGAPPSVSVYTDQVPRNVPVMSDALDLDIERVEVLKGPQGTLFGQSSTGGAINYIVGKPTKDFHAGFNASYERFDRAELGGFVSGPLADTVQARLAVKAVTGGAWQHSISRPTDTNGAARKYSGRLTVDLQPADNLKIELMATGSRDKSDPLAPQYTGTLFNTYGTAAAAAASGNPYAVVNAARYAALTTSTSAGYDASFVGRQSVLVGRLNGTNAAVAAGAKAILGAPIANDAQSAEWTPGFLKQSDNDYYQLSGRLDYNLTPSITVTSVTALARAGLKYNQDLDGTTATVADVPLFGNVKSFNQELRVAGNTDALHWILGGSYDRLTTQQSNYYLLGDYSGNLGLITQTLNDFSSKMETYALFGNAEYKVTSQLTVQGGLRYTNNKQDATYCYNDPASDTAQGTALIYGSALNSVAITIKPGQCFPTSGDLLLGTAKSTLSPVNSSQTEDNVSFRVGVNYKMDQGTLLYATVSQGFKAGTFSAIGASRIQQYTPAVQEKVLAYEAGIKTPLLGKLAHFNGAVFYYDYSNKQVRGRIADPVFGLLEKMLNVPKSYIFGLEGELVVRPADGLNLSASATYLQAKVNGDYTKTTDGQAVFNAQGYSGNFNGSELPYTPKFSANADAQYQFALNGSVNAFVGGTLVYQGRQNATFHTASLLGDDFTIPDYTTLDARAGLVTADGAWRMQVFGRNLTNTTYTTAVSSYLDTSIRYRGKPVTYGLSLSYKY